MAIAKSKVYDINVWVDGTELRMVAYRLFIDSDGYLSSDHKLDQVGEVFSRQMTDKRFEKIVGFLLECEEWQLRGSWDGYDTWFYSDFLLKPSAPKAIRDWYESLPEYEVELVTKG